jgi:hypothetical protein
VPGWRLRTLRNLYRKVIQLRRYFSEERLSDALGILAYAKAFRGIFESSDFGINGDHIIVEELPIYSNEIGTSIAIRRDGVKRVYDRRKTNAQFVLTAVIGITALLIAIYSDFKKGVIAATIGGYLVNLLGTYPIFIVIPVLIGWFSYQLYMGRVDTARFPSIRRVYRLLAWLGKPWFVALGGVLLAITAGTAIYFFFLAFRL